MDKTDEDSRYRTFAEKINKSLLFVRDPGIDTAGDALRKSNFYIAHRRDDNLPYEKALTWRDFTTRG